MLLRVFVSLAATCSTSLAVSKRSQKSALNGFCSCEFTFIYFPLTLHYFFCRWVGARITFGFITCPGCKQDMSHPMLASSIAPYISLRDDVLTKVIFCCLRSLAPFISSLSSSCKARQRALVEFGANIPELAPGRLECQTCGSCLFTTFAFQEARTHRSLKNFSSENSRKRFAFHDDDNVP
jgi:hypothetical protein